VVLLFSIGMAWAENNTTENLYIEDSGNYILPISISDNVIKFDDGFEGFCLDLSKDSITSSDKFELGEMGNSDLENKVKLTIIECYKQSNESDIEEIVKQVLDGTIDNEAIKEALNSNEEIGDEAVVNIDNTTEATFTFELLKSTDDSKSDVLAYRVSTKTVEQPELLGASDDTNVEPTDDNAAQKDTNDKNTNEKTTENEPAEKQTDNTEPNDDEKTEEKQTDNTEPENDTTVTETNNTIVNKTNTVIVNENNTTIINNNNVKTINTTNDTPENDTTSQLLKAAGNPIFILIIVIVIIAIVAVAMRRKD